MSQVKARIGGGVVTESLSQQEQSGYLALRYGQEKNDDRLP